MCQKSYFAERKYTSSSLSNHNHLDKRTSTEKVLSSLATQAARAAINESERNTTSVFNSSSSSPALSYSLGKIQTVKGLARHEQLNHLLIHHHLFTLDLHFPFVFVGFKITNFYNLIPKL